MNTSSKVVLLRFQSKIIDLNYKLISSSLISKNLKNPYKWEIEEIGIVNNNDPPAESNN